MAYLYSLCSSSKGNSYFIGDSQSGVLIDAGIGIREFCSQLELINIDKSAIKAIFLTHEHSDHIKGLSAILKRINVPVYSSKQTLEVLIEKEIVTANNDLNEINNYSVNIDNMQISAFKTPHDSVCSHGYIVNIQDKKACVCTDLGEMTDEVYGNIKQSDLILLESNYDENMLYCGDYPYFLKQRILSSQGHLSNKVCAQTLVRLLNEGTNNFILGHLSQNNNLPILAMETALSELLSAGAKIDNDYKLSIAPIRGIGNCIEF